MELTIAQLINQLTAATYEQQIKDFDFEYDEYSDLVTGGIYTGIQLIPGKSRIFDPCVLQIGYANNSYTNTQESFKELSRESMPDFQGLTEVNTNHVCWCIDTQTMQASSRGLYLDKVNLVLANITLIDETGARLKEVDADLQSMIADQVFKIAKPISAAVKDWFLTWKITGGVNY